MEWQAADGGPEVQGIAVGATGEAVVYLAGEMDREDPAGSRVTAGDGAGAAKLEAAPPDGLKADQVQDLGHRDLLANLMVVDARHEGLAGRIA